MVSSCADDGFKGSHLDAVPRGRLSCGCQRLKPIADATVEFKNELARQALDLVNTFTDVLSGKDQSPRYQHLKWMLEF